jgi:hypothetical protein
VFTSARVQAGHQRLRLGGAFVLLMACSHTRSKSASWIFRCQLAPVNCPRTSTQIGAEDTDRRSGVTPAPRAISHGYAAPGCRRSSVAVNSLRGKTDAAMSLVRIWVYDGILASSVAGASDVFTAANAISAEHLGRGRDKARLLKWRIESLDGRDVQSASNQMIKVDGPINSRAAADVVIVPGPFVRDIERFLKKTDLVAPLLTALRRQHEHGELSSCRGRIAGRRRRHDSLGQGQGFC